MLKELIATSLQIQIKSHERQKESSSKFCKLNKNCLPVVKVGFAGENQTPSMEHAKNNIVKSIQLVEKTNTMSPFLNPI